MEKLNAAQKEFLKNENIQKARNAMRKRQANRGALLRLISCNVRYLCDRPDVDINQTTDNSVRTSLINETIICLEKLKDYEDAQ